MKETALGLLIPETGDPPAGPAQVGGNAEKSDALLQKGGVANHFWSGTELTRASTLMGSFSTPIKVELAVVKPHQVIEINMLVLALGAATPPTLGLRVAGNVVGTGLPGATIADYAVSTTAKYFGIIFGAAGEFVAGGFSVEAGEIGAVISVFEGAPMPLGFGINRAPLIIKNDATERKNLAIEIQGKIASGTAKVRGAWLTAHARA